ncbi:fumarylacetoacetate hydrolase family protein [Oscillibacter valericigenes]|uniref:Fumarylacetoacetate hydrolase family protein n=1 Tax=Oscillibacter valericigenes TaxID=351091 RepID=A0ABS2FXQ2_9FIRM|nr:fumarylacetoacetate hydrolase family protein [Oscillibacter valericigenes]MBM6852105.1 fumarylacetoacetate hydrolase family protein [Oscillibacter valericigenes]MBM6910091.1 fumarylacetoacetate hydrolase family protein [Oscillibacter valericigenes]
MKLITYRQNGAEHVGALTEDGTGVLPLPVPDMNTLIETMTLTDLRSAVAAAERGSALALSDVELLAPIPRPRQDVLCLGMNYLAHAEEAARYSADAFRKERPVAVYFSKRVSEAGKPDGVIPRHAGLTDRLDYEAELAVVLGRTARDVKAADAADCIFGYTVLNDVSARDLQTGHKQWYFGKSLDGATPMGPVLVTADEIAYPPALEITCRVNGELRQQSNTSLLITSIGQILEELTAGMTLLPGTIIATGTPAGVGMGFDPPKFLQSGDVVECAIEGIGTLRSTVV